MDITTQYQPYINKINNDIASEKASKMDEKKLKKAAQDFEAEFFKIMLKESKKTILRDEKAQKAPGKDIMLDFMLERFAEDMASKSPLGLSDMIVKDVQAKSNISSDLNEVQDIKIEQK